MQFLTASAILLLLSNVVSSHRQNILLTNDDGWAVAQIRAQFSALESSGFNLVLSSPAENESGTSSDDATPTVLTVPCEFDTCPVGSPAEGFNASDPRFNYVNSFPVDAVRFGIQTLSPQFFGGPPRFVVSGPNVGTNLGTSTVSGSGTVGAACEAAREGLPSVAFSGSSNAQESFTNLTAERTSSTILAAQVNAQLGAHFTRTILASPDENIVPKGVTLNVNFSPRTTRCTDASHFRWILTRLASNSSAVDVRTCGTDHLPAETTVVDAAGSTECFATVSVINATTKTDVDATLQGDVLKRLRALPFSCFKD